MPNACDETLRFPNANFHAAALRGDARNVQTRKHIVRCFQTRVVDHSGVCADTFQETVYPWRVDLAVALQCCAVRHFCAGSKTAASSNRVWY